MTTVGLDFERLKYPNCGLGEFCLRLAEALSRRADESQLQAQMLEYVYFVPAKLREKFGSRVRYSAAYPWRKFLRAGMPTVNLWHSTHQDAAYGPKNPRTPMVLTIHDLNFLHEKSPAKAALRKKLLQAKIDRAQVLTTVSEFSAREIRNNFKLRDQPLEVIYNGVNLDHLQNGVSKSERPSWAPQRPFFLALGNFSPKKNFHVLLPMMEHFTDFCLVIAGPKQSSYEKKMLEMIRQLRLQSRVVLPGPVSGAIKNWLYQSCTAFLFPSLFEGFGIPVLEAMSFGRPVVCSTRTSLPEIGGEFAGYWQDFDPKNMSQVLTDHLQRYSADPENESKKLVKYAQSFSWNLAAEKYERLYQLNLKDFAHQGEQAGD